jgi:hypothetical protein
MEQKIKALIKEYEERILKLDGRVTIPVNDSYAEGQAFVLENVIEDLKNLLRNL